MRGKADHLEWGATGHWVLLTSVMHELALEKLSKLQDLGIV